MLGLAIDRESASGSNRTKWKGLKVVKTPDIESESPPGNRGHDSICRASIHAKKAPCPVRDTTGDYCPRKRALEPTFSGSVRVADKYGISRNGHSAQFLRGRLTKCPIEDADFVCRSTFARRTLALCPQPQYPQHVVFHEHHERVRSVAPARRNMTLGFAWGSVKTGFGRQRSSLS